MNGKLNYVFEIKDQGVQNVPGRKDGKQEKVKINSYPLENNNYLLIQKDQEQKFLVFLFT